MFNRLRDNFVAFHGVDAPIERVKSMLDVPAKVVTSCAPTSHNPHRNQSILVAVLLLLAVLCLRFDAQIYARLASPPIRQLLLAVLHRYEPFGHAYGAAMILIAVGVSAPKLWPSVRRISVCLFTAGIAAEIGKLAIYRTRPGRAFVGSSANESVADVFPHLNRDFVLSSVHQSFPSAHTALAFALAFGLAQLFPNGRGVFFLCASLVALQRVVDGRHFPSDVLVGAAIGLSAAYFWHLNDGVRRSFSTRGVVNQC